jgi:Rnl2 family RNA ligase
MEHKKYPSIENTYRETFVQKAFFYGYHKQEWVVTNKVHGGNLAFHTDGEEVLTASKNGITENFYGRDIVLNRYRERILEAFEVIQRNVKTPIKQVSLYGEVFGGSYPHPDVPKVPGANRIQKGVFYTPNNDWYLIDVMIDGVLVDYDFAMGLSFYLECPYAHPLHRGTLQSCLEYPNDFDDPTYKYYGLPKIEGNITEGIVIRPVEPLFFPDGRRVILKNKNEKFSEKQREPRKQRIRKELPEDVQVQIDNGSQYVTENRLNNVLSHFGPVEDKQFGKLIGEFSKDVLEDYLKDYGDEYNSLDKQKQGMVKKNLQKMCAEFLKPRFLEIVT